MLNTDFSLNEMKQTKKQIFNLDGIRMTRSCGKKPIRPIAAQPKEEEVSEADEEVDPVNVRPRGQLDQRHVKDERRDRVEPVNS
jgi:hypothetical protein